MPKPSWYKSASEEEQKAYDQQVELADMEFTQEIASYLDNYGRKSVDEERYRVGPDLKQTAGLYASQDPENRKLVQGAFDEASVDIEAEPDTIYLFGSDGMSGRTPEHETLHREHERRGVSFGHRAHLDVYVQMGFRAGTKGDWEEAVSAFKAYVNSVSAVKIDDDEADALLQESVTSNEQMLIAREARAGLEGRTAVAYDNPNNPAQVGLLQSYEDQSKDLFDYRRRRVTN